MAVLRYFHQDPKQTSVQESSIVDRLGTVLTLKLTNINQSISNNTLAIDDKLNSIPGKSLSTNDFTDEYKDKLRGIEEGAEVNVQSDWGENDDTADSYIKNKPIIDTVVTDGSNNLVTSGAVFTAIDELPEPMIFKGSLGVGGTIQTLPAASRQNVGFVYKVITAGAYYGIDAKPGDSFISDGLDWILIPSGDEPEGTVMSIGLTVPTGLKVSGSPITTSGTLAISYALGYAIPTIAKQEEWDAKQDAISDLSTIRSNASHGETAYGWGNHALAGYQPAISDLSTIRSNASEGHTAYGWGDHSKAGYVKSSGVTSVAMTVPTGLAISGSPITSTGTLALSFANGYSIPTTAKLSNWDTAYSWGNHASAGYVKSSGVTKISTTDGVVGGDITTTGTIKANLASYTKNASDIGGKLYAVQLDKSGRLAVNVPWVNTWTAWKGATSSAAGTAGYMPAPTKDQYHLFLRGDGTWVSLNNYSLPLAASGTRGGVLIGFTTDAANRNYAVLLSGEKMYVNVPWTDNNTTYPLAVKDISRSGTTFTATRYDGTTFTFTQQDNNTTYSAGTGLSLNGTKFSLALTKALVTDALGYTPPTLDTNTTYSAGSGLSLSGTTFSLALTKALVTTALGYTPPTQDTNTWRGITDSYSGTDSTISLSLKGGKALYDALVNGYANSAGNADTVDNFHVDVSGNGPTWGRLTPVKSDGILEVGKYIDFHNTSNDGKDYATRVLVTQHSGNSVNLPTANGTLALTSQIPTKASWNYNDMYVSSLTTSGNYLRWVKNGSNNDITIPYATNSDTVDGYHASNLVHNASAVNVFTDEAGWEIIMVSNSKVDDNFPSGKYGSCILWANNPNQKPSVVNTANWYNQLFGLTDNRLYFRTRTNGGSWTTLNKIAYVSEIPTNNNQLTNGAGYITGITKTMVTNALGYTPPTADTNTHRPILVNGTEVLGNNTTALNLKAGSNVTLSNSSGTVTIAATNTNNAVALTNTTTNAFYRLLFSGTADDTNRTEGARKNTNIKVNPSYGGVHANGFFHSGASLSDTWTDSYNKNHPWYGIDFRGESGSNYFHSVYSDYFGMCFRTCYIKIAVGDFSAGASEQSRTIYINNPVDTNPIIFSVAGTISAELDVKTPSLHNVGKLYIQSEYDDSTVIIGANNRLDDSAGPFVGIGKINPSYKLHVNGACGATSHPTTSDIRLKDILSNILINVEDIANAPSFLFKWKLGGDNLVHVGTSAQYWKEKVPELVSEANDDIKTLSLDYSALSVASNVTLAKEVVSLKEEIKLLQALIAELKLLLNN